jgi:hypothetical protein
MHSSSRIEFSVRYRLREYLQFVTEHAFDTQDALRTLDGARRHLARIALQSVATLGFVYKSSRVGRCDFAIDAAGVSRRTKSGLGSVPWSRVKAVHIYSLGFLVELESGAMPIPFRVLSPEQHSQFCLLAADLLVTGAQPNNSFKPNPLRGSA